MLRYLHKLGNRFYQMRIPLLPKIIYYIQYFMFNSSVPPSVKIGKGSKFAYGGIGVVIHGRAVIGENCIIGQGITIGGKSKEIEVPIIGDNVYISAGVRILGPIKIGNNVVIGANAVVIKDVPNNCIVAGIPARIIRSGIQPSDYI